MRILAFDSLPDIALPYLVILGLAVTIVIVAVMLLAGWRPNAKEEIKQAKRILKSVLVIVVIVLCATGAIALGVPGKPTGTGAAALIIAWLGIIWRRDNEREERPPEFEKDIIVNTKNKRDENFAERKANWPA